MSKETVQAYLGKCILPDLIIRKSKSSCNTTKAAHGRYCANIRDWDTFESDLLPSSEFLIENYDKEIDLYRSSRRGEVASEACIERELYNQMFGPVMDCLAALGYPLKFSKPAGMKTVRFNPDFVFCDDENPIFCIEVKTPWSLITKDEEDEHSVFNVVDQYENNDVFSNAIDQIYGYMSFNHQKYGMLTNYDQTFFLKRIDGADTEVQVSRAVQKSEVIRKLLEFCFLAYRDPFYTSPAASPSDLMAKSLKVPLKPDETTATTIYANEFYFRECIHTSNNGNVIRGQIAGLKKDVLFKTRNIAKEHGILKSMETEVAIYNALSPLQGNIIPRLYGFVNFNGYFHALILEDVGTTLSKEDVNDDVIFEIKKAVKQIHDCGVLHRDLAARNICFDKETNQVKIIDFNRAEFCTDQAKQATELNRITYRTLDF